MFPMLTAPLLIGASTSQHRYAEGATLAPCMAEPPSDHTIAPPTSAMNVRRFIATTPVVQHSKICRPMTVVAIGLIFTINCFGEPKLQGR